MITLPGQSGWQSRQSSDLAGNIVATKNIDFNEDGYVSLGRKPMAIFTEHTGVSGTGDADFQDVVALVADATYLYAVTTDHVFGGTISETAITWGEVTISGAPTVTAVDDAVLFDGKLVISGTSAVTTLTGFNGTNGSGTWTDKSISLTASYPHPLCVLEHRRELAVALGEVTASNITTTNIATYATNTSGTYTIANTLKLPPEYIVTTMRFRGNNLYIGTRTLSGSRAVMFVWNGTGSSAQYAWPVDADWIYAMTEYGSSVAVLTSAGQLLKFNGGGFDILANLPVYYTPYSWSQNAGASAIGKAVNRGIWAIGDTIYFTIQGETRGLFSPGSHKQPGGLWCYDPKVSLYHKAGFVTEPYRSLSISSLASSIFTFATAHGAETGDPVWAASVSNIAALTAGYVYYAIKESTTSIKLARSPADAFAGRSITASGTISGDALAFDTLDAVANTNSCIPGPVYGFNKNQFSPFFAAEVLFCGSAEDPIDATTASLMSLGMGRNVGSFITPKLPASNIKDTFQKIVAGIRGLNLDTDKVVIKYRTSERFGLPPPVINATTGFATWTNATTFTVNTAGKDVRSARVGDEVEFIRGAAAGYSAHITAIDDSTSTWTITLDESIPDIAASDTSDFYVQNWTKLATITNDSRDIPDSFADVPVGATGSWIQFKIELRGRDVSIPVLQLDSK